MSVQVGYFYYPTPTQEPESPLKGDPGPFSFYILHST